MLRVSCEGRGRWAAGSAVPVSASHWRPKDGRGVQKKGDEAMGNGGGRFFILYIHLSKDV